MVFHRARPSRRGLSRADLSSAIDSLETHGATIIEGAVDAELIQRLKVACFESFGGLSQPALEARGSRVGHDRYMLSIDFEPPWTAPEVYASSSVLPIVRALLGEDCVINSFCAVIAYPGSNPQHIHLDHSLLFESEPLSLGLPTYAITAIIPLIDLSLDKTGSTRVWPKRSRRAAPTLWEQWTGSHVLDLKAGDVCLMDYRMCHGGTKNPGPIPRPIIYMVYSRPWFRDSENFNERAPLRITPEILNAIPTEYEPLFALARSLLR